MEKGSRRARAHGNRKLDGKGLKGRCGWDIKEKFFTERVVRWAQAVVESPSLDVALGDVVSGGFGSAGSVAGLSDLRDVFQPKHFPVSVLHVWIDSVRIAAECPACGTISALALWGVTLPRARPHLGAGLLKVKIHGADI